MSNASSRSGFQASICTRVGTLCDAGHSHLEQDASLRIAQVELVGTEGTLLAARDDDGG